MRVYILTLLFLFVASGNRDLGPEVRAITQPRVHHVTRDKHNPYPLHTFACGVNDELVCQSRGGK
jgi:hypothetical protein